MVGLQASAKAHDVTQLRAHELPGVAVDQPVIRLLNLAAVNNALAKHAVLVADAITNARQSHSSDGVQKAGRQPAQAAIAQSGIGLDIDQRVKVCAQL